MGNGLKLRNECYVIVGKFYTSISYKAFISMKRMSKHPWLKNKRYLHVTPQIDTKANEHNLLARIKNTSYISKYAFFPLIYSEIKERRYKKSLLDPQNKRKHSFKKDGLTIKNAKKRPLHYATHMDALIFGYYAHQLQSIYDKLLESKDLSECIIAYRKIKIEGSDKGKSTIHFAHELFQEIKKRSENKCIVLKLDIKSFFNELDHGKLKSDWIKLLDKGDKLPADHYNVYKAATRFSYILKDDLRISPKYGKRTGFDEKKLAKIRNTTGNHCFFESITEFRNKIKNGDLKLYKLPFGSKKGIPQGLAISAVLANLYLLEFDLKILAKVVDELKGYYRRYSDDIIIVCRPEEANVIENFVLDAIRDSKLEISPDKRETFLFKKKMFSKGRERIVCTKIGKEEQQNTPLTYLGFEFYGYKTLIKSANLSKFYRRMILAVKRRAKRATAISRNLPGTTPVIFKRQLYRLYTKQSLNDKVAPKRLKSLEKNDKNLFKLVVTDEEKSPKKTQKKHKVKRKSNYLSYVRRVSFIMNNDQIKRQIRNHRKVFNAAIKKHLSKGQERLD